MGDHEADFNETDKGLNVGSDLDGTRSGGFRLSKTPREAHAPEREPELELLGALPDDYGSGYLYLTARDPQWLYCYWDLDLTVAQARAADGAKASLRLYRAGSDAEAYRAELSPAARDWHIPVPTAPTAGRAGERYYAELGLADPRGRWAPLARSQTVEPPVNRLSEERARRYATIPFTLSFQAAEASVKESRAREDEPLAETLSRLQTQNPPGEERPLPYPVGATPISDAAMARIAENAFGSWNEKWALKAAGAERMGPGGPSSYREKRAEAEEEEAFWQLWLSSPSGGSALENLGGASWSGPRKEKSDFFLNVNAEVIFHGATEPGAKLWVNGKPTTLEADGTFRFHCKFADGRYEIGIVAESSNGERRDATLHFVRETKGNAGVAPARELPELGI